MLANLPPEHMDRWSRNERLYRHLLGMGLVVSPIFADDDRTMIDHLWVSADLPIAGKTTQQPSQCSIGGPMERPEIRNVIGTATGHGSDVIDFPAVDGVSVSVLKPVDGVAEDVPPPECQNTRR